jgi:hypothetical protein
MADVVISTEATQNMSCSGGICAPTASDAVLNTTDIENMLASGPLTVTTTGSGVQASNIDVTAAFLWSAANTLTLDANQSITVSARVTDSGDGGVSLVTNDGGSGEALSFLTGGNITISSDKDRLTINGEAYTLEKDIAGLAHDIVAHPKGRFALANDYDAKQNKLFRSPPIPVEFAGTLNGLGHAIRNVEIGDISDMEVGVFAGLASPGTISSIGLQNIVVQSGAHDADVGGLVGVVTGGAVQNSWVSGRIQGDFVGGLVGTVSSGAISNSWSSAQVRGYDAGGLVGGSEGEIENSFASGTVVGADEAGGLVGASGGDGRIANSYATGVSKALSGAIAGGLVGVNASVSSSYSTGQVKGVVGAQVGGFIGYNPGTIENCVWDTTTSKTKIGVGGGFRTGLRGLTTRELRSRLPKGFDPSIWAEDAAINNGFPYLIANPPQ